MIYRKAFAVGICIVKQWKERLGEQYMNTSQAEGIDQLQSWINDSKRIVFFGGAGVSTESGIPDFRGEKGIYKTISEYGVNPETILSHTFFENNKEVFFDYCKKNLIYTDAKPNAAHYALAKLEEEGKLKAVITQNIDNLHQEAGSKNVLELHGTLYKNYLLYKLTDKL